MGNGVALLCTARVRLRPEASHLAHSHLEGDRSERARAPSFARGCGCVRVRMRLDQSYTLPWLRLGQRKASHLAHSHLAHSHLAHSHVAHSHLEGDRMGPSVRA